MSRFRPLKKREVLKILKQFGFEKKKTVGSHAQFEGYIDEVRRVVTVDMAIDEFCKKLLSSMISQSGKKKKEWYAAINIK